MIDLQMLLAPLQVASPAAEGWEVVKGVMLTLTTTAAVATARTVIKMAREFRDVKTIVVGVDGKNGLKSDVKNLIYRVDNIDERHSNIDAIAEFERQQHPGPERRQSIRRFRDQAFPNPLDETEEERQGGE